MGAKVVGEELRIVCPFCQRRVLINDDGIKHQEPWCAEFSDRSAEGFLKAVIKKTTSLKSVS